MTPHQVVLTDDAQTDLQDIYDYVADHDAPLKADQLLENLEKLVAWSWKSLVIWECATRDESELSRQVKRFLAK